MSSLDLSTDLKQEIVNGVMAGYKHYLELRKQKNEELEVSSAFAWTKGNYVDSSVYSQLSDNGDVTIEHAKAGFAWEYLQFQLSNTDDQYLMMIKNAKTAEKQFDGKKMAKSKNNYLENFAKINNDVLDSHDVKMKKQQVQLSLELTPNELQSLDTENSAKVAGNFNRFYLVTYEIDEVTKLISRIRLVMPSYETMSLLEIADLSQLIELSGIDFGEEELASVKKDRIPDSTYVPEPELFGYGIAEEESNQENDQNKAN